MIFSDLLKNFKIKALFEKHDLEPVALGEARLQDGVIVVFPGDMPIVGDPIGVMVEGNPEPVIAPEGKHMLEDGSTLVVDANGIIVEIIPAVIEEEQSETSTSAGAESPEAQAKRIVESIVKETEFSAAVKALIDEAITPLKQENENLKKELEKEKQSSEAMFKVIEKISGEPAAAPVKKEKDVPTELSAVEIKQNRSNAIYLKRLEMLNKNKNN